VNVPSPKGERPLRRTPLSWLLWISAALLVAAAAAGYLVLRASLPRLEGEVSLGGLESPVAVERDAAGVPVIRGASRIDVARATGYVHAQDRWFQMDLLRRGGAGELAALLGPALVERDRAIRRHQFRKRAREVLEQLEPRDRALLEAYAEGVNAALADNGARPFEYILLGAEPEPWWAEDSLLAVFAQWIDLQGLDDIFEQQNGRLTATLPAPLVRFLIEPDPAWEAPLDASRLEPPPLPTADEYDLRKVDRRLFDRIESLKASMPGIARADDPAHAAGSNNWALSGARTAGGGALLANDMHLRLRVPNVWYRARLVVAGAGIDVCGVTLPGVPAVVAGSNGHVAWGFTNSYGDFQDLVAIERAPGNADAYLTADGPRAFEQDIERIEVAGAATILLPVRRTMWGPVVARDGNGHELALAWTAHGPGTTDLGLLALERARDLDAATAILAGAAMPAQNALIADRSGRIGWVLSGRLPVRSGFDPRLPEPWHAPDVGWQGWHPREASPQLLDPPAGIAWSANARVVGGDTYERIGDGGFAPAARSRQIRARLAGIEAAMPADLLAIQLDDRAVYLSHWQPLFVAALARVGAAEAAGLVRNWSGHAAVDDPGFRLVREFERRVVERSFAMLAIEAAARWPSFPWQAPQRFTETAWRLLRERPVHLLDPRFSSWDAWLDDVASEVVATLPPGCTAIARCPWGRVNTAAIRHPISLARPMLAGWLDMAAEPLPGDWSTPRVQSPAFGASVRFVVSPGREAEGFFHMPGGQSGHPLSPFYRAGHDAWVRGEPTPFLPGEARHELRLVPAKH
jgi:penicillin amidase